VREICFCLKLRAERCRSPIVFRGQFLSHGIIRCTGNQGTGGLLRGCGDLARSLDCAPRTVNLAIQVFEVGRNYPRANAWYFRHDVLVPPKLRYGGSRADLENTGTAQRLLG
jgi:hypothetical protein